MPGRSGRTSIFDEVAGLYDEVRPHYPSELVDDILSLSGIPPQGRILEIGCGTGQATIAFARLGYSMLCLEPGPNLASLAGRNLREYPTVEIRTVTFEDWQLEENAFDLVMAANAFHWIAPEIAYPKAAQALKDSGALAIFRNADPYPQSGFFRELQRLYEEHAPELAEQAPRKPAPAAVDRREVQINETGLFEKVTVRHYPWAVRYDATSYVKLLDTYSDHHCLPENTKRNLFDAIARLIERHGGTFTKPYDAVLYLAKRTVRRNRRRQRQEETP